MALRVTRTHLSPKARQSCKDLVQTPRMSAASDGLSSGVMSSSVWGYGVATRSTVSVLVMGLAPS